MKVLLLSPLPKIDVACGDVTYTELLLAYPPLGVQYETYADALERGSLREHGTGRALKKAILARHRLAAHAALTVTSKTVNLLRKKQWMFWEPHRFFSVEPGEYDLIHMHCFSARFFSLPCPLVISNSAPLRYLYTEARKYSDRRVKAMEFADMRLGRLLGVNVNSYNLPQASRVIAMTHFLKKWYVDRKIAPADRVDAIPFFVPSSPLVTPRPNPNCVGFIAKDFDAKGGRVLLQAFEQVRKARRDARLMIVGSPQQISDTDAAARGITWIPYIPREELMRDILPQFDVFAYPTEFDGLPLVSLEAMSYGVPLATSDYQAMPEVVGHGQAGLVSPCGVAGALAKNILTLLDPVANAQYRTRARVHFEQTYSASAVRPQLLTCYRVAISQYQSQYQHCHAELTVGDR